MSSTGGSRVQEALQGFPLGTLTILAVNIGIFVLQSLFDFSVAEYAIAAAPVILKGQIYRIYTAALLHGGLMHIGMNMMSTASLGSGLEAIFGTAPFMILVFWMMTFGGGLYVFLSWVLHYFPSPVGGLIRLYQPAVGFSGVIFSMAVLESSLSPFPSRSVFGLFEVPTKLYPWVLMALIQVIMPNISLMGHLCGILAGFLYIYGYLNCLFPHNATVQNWEQHGCLRKLSRQSNYVRCPDQAPGFGSGDDQQSAVNGAISMVSGFCAGLRSCITSVCGISFQQRPTQQPSSSRRMVDGEIVAESGNDIEGQQERSVQAPQHTQSSLLEHMRNAVTGSSRSGSYERVPTEDEDNQQQQRPESSGSKSSSRG